MYNIIFYEVMSREHNEKAKPGGSGWGVSNWDLGFGNSPTWRLGVGYILQEEKVM
jgi:hypothetical protein